LNDKRLLSTTPLKAPLAAESDHMKANLGFATKGFQNGNMTKILRELTNPKPKPKRQLTELLRTFSPCV